jgi:FkbM family methyltransferase
LHPDDVPETAKHGVRLAVSIVTAPYVAIEQSLLQLGFKDVVPFYDLAESFRQLHPLSNGWFAQPLAAEDQRKTDRVLAQWADDVSRAHHLQFLAWRRLREEWMFERAPVSNSDRFFIPEVASVLNGHEILLDGGAHYGNVTTMFARQTNGAYRDIIAIEPDPSNRARLRETAAANDIRVSIHDCALAESESQTQFHDGLGYASQISTTGRMNVATRPLDALGVSPTYIKLHLEGGELSALKGARETLLSSRPIVAATVYHNADGIWRTPLWLMDQLPDYRFLFRAHTWCGTGAVVYAIPNERCEA